MEVLIYVHHWGDESCSGSTFFPFEYEGKDKFVFDTLEKFKDHPWEYYGKTDYQTSTIEIFQDIFLTKGELEELEKYVMTLAEWIESEKIKVI